MKKKLTAKQEMFCREYLIDLNATQAAIRAGYSEKTSQIIGSENLSKPLVADYISELMTEREESTRIDAEWVLKTAHEVVERCMQVAPVRHPNGDKVQDEDGNPVYGFDPKNVIAGLQVIGKHVNVKAFDNTMKIIAKIEKLTDNELDQELYGLITPPQERENTTH